MMSRAARSRRRKISRDGEALLNLNRGVQEGRKQSRPQGYGKRGERRRLRSGAYRAPQRELGRSGSSRRRRGRVLRKAAPARPGKELLPKTLVSLYGGETQARGGTAPSSFGPASRGPVVITEFLARGFVVFFPQFLLISRLGIFFYRTRLKNCRVRPRVHPSPPSSSSPAAALYSSS
jgi:hypothetical protein